MSAQPGQFGLAIIGGRLGSLVWLGQTLVGDRSKWTHAFLVLDAKTIIEAEVKPHGARLGSLQAYEALATKGQAVFSDLTLTPEQVSIVVQSGREFVGVPYSFFDYLSIALVHFHIRPAWVTRYVESSKSMICSQLVDRCYDIAGVHLFSDGRKPGDVTPGDLTRCLSGKIPI